MRTTEPSSMLHDVTATLEYLTLAPKIRNTQAAIYSPFLCFFELVGIGDIWPEALGARETCLDDAGVGRRISAFFGTEGIRGEL